MRCKGCDREVHQKAEVLPQGIFCPPCIRAGRHEVKTFDGSFDAEELLGASSAERADAAVAELETAIEKSTANKTDS